MDTSEKSTDSGQYLTFILRGEFFAVVINKVREVLDVTTLTRVPRMPDYISGVINLRGAVVPVIDLGFRLGMPPVEKTVNTCIMIVEIEVEGEEDKVEMGVLSDAVQEVIDLSNEDIESTPSMGSGLNTDFIKGMGRQGDKFLILLDIDKTLSAEGEAVLQDMQAAPDNEGEESAAA